MNEKEMIEEMAKVIDDRLIEANNYLGSMNKGTGYWIAQKLVEHYQPKIPEGSVVLTKEEYEGKEIVVEMSGGHKLRLTVGKFGEMSRVLEESTRKETAKEIFKAFENELCLYYPHGQISYDVFQTVFERLAKKFGVEVEE